MATKVKEITSNPNGDRNVCDICTPKPERVSMTRLWAWSLANPGKKPFKS